MKPLRPKRVGRIHVILATLELAIDSRTESIRMTHPTSIHTINARDGIGLTSMRSYFEMDAKTFRQFIVAHAALLQEGLHKHKVDYAALRPALVPHTERHEMAMLFNSEIVGGYAYGDAIMQRLIPLLAKDSTLSVMVGDIGYAPTTTRQFAEMCDLVPSDQADWGPQYVFCVYLNNLTETQVSTMHTAFLAAPGYLGYVPTTYRSHFRTLVSNEVGTVFIKHKDVAIVDHGGDDPWVGEVNMPAYPFEENGLRVVSVNSMLFSPLLVYKIQSETFPHHREDVEVSLSAISDTPVSLAGFDVLIDQSKFGYLTTSKGEILKIAGLDQHSKYELASLIRAELESDYIYRLQHNPDDTVQFSIVLELLREAHPVKVAVGLKYFPRMRSLLLVTLT